MNYGLNLRIVSAIALLSSSLWFSFSSIWAGETLTLRVEEATARPGGLASVVLRTYAPKPIRQGQVCIVACLGQVHDGGNLPFDDLENAIVFSEFHDVVSLSTFENENGTQTAIIEFTSDLAGVNLTDGPMAAFFLRLGLDTVPGQEIELFLDPAETWLFDENGEPIEIDFRSSSLNVIAESSPYMLSTDGDQIAPGGVAILGVETGERFLLSSGKVTFLYPKEIASALPLVTMDPRHGQATFVADVSQPGQVTITFESGDLSLNDLPGNLITIALPTRADLPVGHRAALSLDPLNTYLVDADGKSLNLQLEGDEIVFQPLESLFSDGFESGNLQAWTLVAP